MSTYEIPPELLVPEGDIEKQKVAMNLYEERQLCKHDALVDSLTRRERLLVETAYAAGADETRTSIANRLRNPQAVTLDAAAVSEACHRGNAPHPRIDFPRPRIPGQHHDHRIVGIVVSVDQILEYEKSHE